MTSKIDVRQIYFAEWQMALLEPEFTPFSNAGCPLPDEREFYVFRTEYAREPVPDDVLRGYVSWKFRSKSDISGRSFVDFIRENPGHDVYFVQPFPLDLAKGNVWSQGELYHPGIIDMTQEIFDAIGYDIDLRRIPTSLRINAACNFWVGNRRFWDGYMAFCLPIYKYIEEAMPPEQRRKLLRPADRTIPASYFSFIFERLFTTLLAAQPSIKALAYTYGGDELAAKYEPNAAALAAALQRTEALHPSVPGTIS